MMSTMVMMMMMMALTFCPTLWAIRISLTLVVMAKVSNSFVRAAISYKLGPVVGGKPGGLMESIFLWAARGSRSGADWERLGSVPNLRVLGIIGVSKGGLTRDSGILERGRAGGIP